MEFFILMLILPFGAWSLRKIFRAITKDRKIMDIWISFARAKNLSETVVEQNGSGITDMTISGLKHEFSSNPVKKSPSVGSVVYSGTNNGLPFIMDSVQFDKRWTEAMDTYTRMAIKVPGMPVQLSVRCKRRWNRFKKDSELDNREFDSLFIVDGDSAKDYLTKELQEALIEFERNFGGFQIFNGHIYLIHKGGISNYTELERMYSGLWSMAQWFKRGN